ncbi:MAG TPA: hypothetical protein VIM65_20460 [Cyclobacteriaceae bacterium]
MLLNINQIPDPKTTNSSMSLIIPGTATTVFPERLGSLGTANIPHNVAIVIGRTITKIYFSMPVWVFHAQYPDVNNTSSSRRNRNARLIG